jgi:hypothetical protein
VKVETVAEARARLLPPRRPPAAQPVRSRRGRGRGGRERTAPSQPPPEPVKKLSEQDVALLAALDLTLALGRADGATVAGVGDAVGYQPLPLSGELAEPPPKPISREQIQTRVGARTVAPLGELPVSGFEVLKRAAVRELFPAVGEWMLPSDWAVVVQPAGSEFPWVRNQCCIVVRLRAQKPAILGGNLLEVLAGGGD